MKEDFSIYSGRIPNPLYRVKLKNEPEFIGKIVGLGSPMQSKKPTPDNPDPKYATFEIIEDKDLYKKEKYYENKHLNDIKTRLISSDNIELLEEI